MIDKRVSLWDIHKQEFCVGKVTYLLEKAPKKGATCIVYDVLKHEQVGGEIYPQRVLLKEFYPLLSAELTNGICREETGTLTVSERVQESGEYKQALIRFKNAYSTIRELANADEGAEFLSIPTSLILANGTWYMEEPYDSGVTFAELFPHEEGGYFEIDRFLEIFSKCLVTVARLHARGYYHLDLTPWNVSYTKSGNIKLFDTDSFMKKSELKNQPMLLQTKGYSAPEVSYAGKDAFYLVGPWTDIYSLAQFICWYIYGRPLEQREIPEKLQHMEDVIYQRFEVPPNISRKGLFRLKAFLAENLNRDTRLRKQKIINEAFLYTKWHKYGSDIHELRTWEDTYVYDEIMLLREFLFEQADEPMDNFRESKEAIEGCEEELECLDEYFYNSPGYSAAALIGANKEKREALARYYATIHRLDYSDIVEIHCENFEDLSTKIPMRIGMEGFFQNPHVEYPFLFIIFDECEEEFCSEEEIVELHNLIKHYDRQVLIVGKYNRYMDCYMDSMKDKLFKWICVDDEADRIFIPTVNMDMRRSELIAFEQLLKDIPNVPKWSWKKWAGKVVLAVVLFLLGSVMSRFLCDATERYMYFDSESGRYLCDSWLMVTGIMTSHIFANGINMLGVVTGIYCFYDLAMSRGVHWFARQYKKYMMVGWLAMTSLNMPHIFRAFSFQSLCDIFGFQYWMQIEKCLEVLHVPVMVMFMSMILIWVIQIFNQDFTNSFFFKFVSCILMCLALAHITIQTIGNPWALELVIHGVWILVAERYIHNNV